MIPNKLTTEEKEQRVFVGKIRLIKQPDIEELLATYENGSRMIKNHPQPPKLQQFDGKDWVDVEIVELEDKVTI